METFEETCRRATLTIFTKLGKSTTYVPASGAVRAVDPLAVVTYGLPDDYKGSDSPGNMAVMELMSFGDYGVETPVIGDIAKPDGREWEIVSILPGEDALTWKCTISRRED